MLKHSNQLLTIFTNALLAELISEEFRLFKKKSSSHKRRIILFVANLKMKVIPF